MYHGCCVLAFLFLAQFISEVYLNRPLWIVTTQLFLVAITVEQIEKQSGQEFPFVKALARVNRRV
jgi:hypothetical protein